MHTYIPTYLHTYIPTYLHTYIPTYRYIPTYLHTYIPIYLPTYLPAYIHTCDVTCFNQPRYIRILCGYYNVSDVTKGAIAKALEYDPHCLHGHGCVNDRNIILYCIHVAFVVSYCLTVPHLQWLISLNEFSWRWLTTSQISVSFQCGSTFQFLNLQCGIGIFSPFVHPIFILTEQSVSLVRYPIPTTS